MKLKITLISALLMSCMAFSQTRGINYKALIKDNLGNVVANSNVTMQFTILKGATQVNVYRENHTPTTDANGIVIVNIGEGAVVSGTFNSIIWSNDIYFLNTQVNTGSGLVDMGTTEFKTVPYALHALNASNTVFSTTANLTSNAPGNVDTDSFVFGSNQLNFNGASTGVRDSRMFFNKNKAAFRAGATLNNGSSFPNDGTTWNDIYVGLYSFASGRNTIASGEYSTAMGSISTASGYYSTAMGENTSASGFGSTAMGASTLASGFQSTAIGNQTIASGDYSTTIGRLTRSQAFANVAIGRYNVGNGNSISWISTDPLFEIGNGTADNSRTNALTVLKNGTITAPSFDIAEITDNKALITKEYLETQVSGLEALDEGDGIGWRIIGRNPNNYGIIGLGAIDLNYSNSGTTYGATGHYSAAMGRNNTASGYAATSLGETTVASGNFSTSMGDTTSATGNTSISMGYSTTASGNFSTAMGGFTKAKAYYDVAIGRFNVGNGNVSSWISTDPLFEIGNGTADNSRNNALTVLKNGNVGIGTITPGHLLDVDGRIRVRKDANSAGIWYSDGTNDRQFAGVNTHSATGTEQKWGVYNNNAWRFIVQGNGNVGIGTTDPQSPLHIVGGLDASTTNGTGAFIIGYENGTNMVMDSNEIQARSNGLVSTLYLQQAGGNVAVNGAVVHTSDRRLKKDITDIPYGLKEIMQLQPKTYNWKNRETPHKSLGLIAQDLQPIIKELVYVTDEDTQLLSVNYTELIPVLIKAIQEQQEIIDNQAKTINNQDSKINTLTVELDQLKTLDTRVKQIESLLKTSNQ